MENKQFKIGDQVAILATVSNIEVKDSYPVKLSYDGNENNDSCTLNGKILNKSTIQNVFHIEDLQLKSEFPKWMQVSEDGKNWTERKVIYIDSYGGGVAIYIHQQSPEGGTKYWKFVKDPKNETKSEINKDEIKSKIAGIQESLTAIIKEIEKK
jgi:hypothetical protein